MRIRPTRPQLSRVRRRPARRRPSDSRRTACSRSAPRGSRRRRTTRGRSPSRSRRPCGCRASPRRRRAGCAARRGCRRPTTAARRVPTPTRSSETIARRLTPGVAEPRDVRLGPEVVQLARPARLLAAERDQHDLPAPRQHPGELEQHRDPGRVVLRAGCDGDRVEVRADQDVRRGRVEVARCRDRRCSTCRPRPARPTSRRRAPGTTAGARRTPPRRTAPRRTPRPRRNAGPVASRGPIVPARCRTVRIARSASKRAGAGAGDGVRRGARCGTRRRGERRDQRVVRDPEVRTGAPGREGDECDGGDEPAGHGETVVRRAGRVSPLPFSHACTSIALRRTLAAAAVLPLVLVAAACAPESDGESSATDPAGSTSASADACATDALALKTAGQLTVGTDSPAYEPWFVDNDPANGKGFESAVAYAVAEQLGFSKDQVKWIKVPFNTSYAPGREGLRLRHQPDLDHPERAPRSSTSPTATTRPPRP